MFLTIEGFPLEQEETHKADVRTSMKEMLKLAEGTHKAMLE
jgi:hypothetical protein